MSVIEETTHKGFPKPHQGNQLRADVERLRTALDMLDTYLHEQRARVPFVLADGTETTIECVITHG